jgi:hypothetical protein
MVRCHAAFQKRTQLAMMLKMGKLSQELPDLSPASLSHIERFLGFLARKQGAVAVGSGLQEKDRGQEIEGPEASDDVAVVQPVL